MNRAELYPSDTDDDSEWRSALNATAERWAKERAIDWPVGAQRCAQGRCPQPAVLGKKTCVQCRATQERHRGSNKRKASMKKHSQTDKYKAARKRYNESDKGRAAIARRTEMYTVKLATSLQKMMKNNHVCPTTFPRLGVFANNQEARQHFESTWEPWMNWSNYGAYRSGDDYETKWNIGHRLPRAVYDHSNPEDVKNCWSRANLFAQCARANIENQDTVFPSVALSLTDIWPTAGLEF